MKFNKIMIDLVREIRKHAEGDIKPAIKLANPDLFHELVLIYHQSKNSTFRSLVKELFDNAQGGWSERLDTVGAQVGETSGRHTTKMYRGQATLVESVGLGAPAALKDSIGTVQKMYRGRPVC